MTSTLKIWLLQGHLYEHKWDNSVKSGKYWSSHILPCTEVDRNWKVGGEKQKNVKNELKARLEEIKKQINKMS